MGCQAEHPMPDLFSTGNGPRCFTAATKTKCHDRRVALRCRSSSIALRDQQRRETIVPCREIFHLIGVGRKQDERLETAAAFPAVPNMTGALIAPVLRPFGGNQLITALNAFHPEAGTTIRSSRPHHSLRDSSFM